MSHNPTTDYIVEDEIVEDDYSADDFAFVIGPDGELKSIVIPEHLMDDPPEEVRAILEIFGIDNIHTLEERTVH